MRWAVMLLAASAFGFVPSTHPRQHARVVDAEPEREPEPTETVYGVVGAPEREQEPTETVYGAHYCGGDPCSSGYNDDPFDEQASKPDDFAAFKKRVQAIVDREAEDAAR